MPQTLSSKPTAKSATPSKPNSISSPAFHDSALAELKDWIEKGHCKVANRPNSPAA